jgi:hypothetical protein
MNVIHCIVRDGAVYFRCDDCGQEQEVHVDTAFAQTVAAVAQQHGCIADAGRRRGGLTLVGDPDDATD